MAHMVNCIKLGREAEGLDYPPLPGALGMKIYNTSFKIPAARGYAAALAWFMLAVIGAITAVLFKTSKWVFYGEEG